MADEVIDNGVTEDEFDLAFNVAVGGEDTSDAGKGEPDEGKTEEGTSDEGKTEEGASDEGKTDEGKIEEGKAGEAEVKPAPKQEVVAAKAASRPDLEVERLAQEAKVKADADAKTENDRLQVEALARESLTPEEQAALKEVEANFPDTASALKSVERVAFAKAENAFNAKLKAIEEKFEQRFAQMGQDFAPAIATAQVVAKNAHQAEILKGHADAFEIVPKVEEWVNTQPDFLKATYNAVLDKGSASQIVELFNIFKKEQNGSVKGPPSSTPTPEETAQKAAKEKKLQSQEGVRSRQAAQKGGIDEDDFESAFKAAANS